MTARSGRAADTEAGPSQLDTAAEVAVRACGGLLVIATLLLVGPTLLYRGAEFASVVGPVGWVVVVAGAGSGTALLFWAWCGLWARGAGRLRGGGYPC